MSRIQILAERSGNEEEIVAGIVGIVEDVLGVVIHASDIGEYEQSARFLYIKENGIIQIDTKMWKNLPLLQDHTPAAACGLLKSLW
ncbi:hypothetical protein RSOLAG1IB_11155 [Rhizoctonia solani AG-1 IB]|uniref:Uncharacterized protein n=1 Tax=Thanatephorus cucumeris (strain AG1-IB / isolate 7/3/14) TaxID=1108050 RepID=A0A0B7F5J2_THACB|nr:hypothetical protein RSOLAG1IB_11155 [Rhizoctonia solani AG-1 IB]